ncbi:MAG TPA: hypothetical protein PK646_01435 [Bacillota bacterium]|nr:hypothetical protein [Fastidiosipila sp.]HPX92866.1 hypothetical protein [Bacillota bacterium]HQB80744.1 hypothetical protein [Bacillota bacterium]
MKQYFILMRPLLSEMIGSFNRGFGLGSRKRKKTKTVSRGTSIALYLFIVLLLSFYSVMYGIGITQAAIKTGNLDGFIHMAAVGAPILILLFGILQAIPTLYHESSLEILLVLPVKPSVIIAGKMTQAFIPVTLFPTLAFLPALITHGVMTARPWPYFVQLVPFMFFIMLAPFALITILVMVLMRYTKFARDKDRFQMVTSVLAILIAIVFSVVINMKNMSDQIPGYSVVAPGGIPPFLQGALRFLPSSAFGVGMLVRAGSWQTLLYGSAALALNAAALALLLLLANKLYLPGVLGLKAGARRHRELSPEQQVRALTPRSAYRAIVSKEWKLLLRTPAFFTQTILGATLFPAMMIGILAVTLVNLEKSALEGASLIAMARSWVASGLWEKFSWLLVLIVSGLAAFFSGTNMMSASSLSRQGSLFAYSKLMPVPIRTQVLAWLTPGMTTMTLIWLILTLGLTVFLSASWFFGLIVFFTAWLNAYLVQMTGFYTDMVFPLLDWTNEIQAVKNTKGALVTSLGMFAYLGLLTGFSFLVLRLSGGRSAVTAVSIFLFALIFSIWISFLVVKRAGRLFRAIDI